jgi:Co/Zn/Cd efflux system component
MVLAVPPFVYEVLRAAMHSRKRGNKRRIARIRWKRREILHAIVLTLVMIAFCLWIAWWVGTRHFD